MRLYLAGPMSGIPDDNFPAFDEAARVLRRQGIDVVNPTEFGEEPAGVGTYVSARVRASYLRLDVREMMGCDSIALLPGWFASVGANIELAVALATGLHVYLYDSEDVLLRFHNPYPNMHLVHQHIAEMGRTHV